MKLSEFITKVETIETIKMNIIKNIPETFDSHLFIRLFSKEFELEYVNFLTEYDKEPFRMVHLQIARFLVFNQTQLGIEDTEKKTESPNIFGDKTSNELWRKH